MLDPLEGVAVDGTIVTGASRTRVGSAYQDVVADTVAAIMDAEPQASVYLYGSVSTGQAIPALSDVDVLTVGLDPRTAVGLSADLSRQFHGRCRGVELSAMAGEEFLGASARAYGNRVSFVTIACSWRAQIMRAACRPLQRM